MKSTTGKNMFAKTSDESTLGTHSSHSEVDEPTKKERTRNVYNNFQLDELENGSDVIQFTGHHAIYLLSKYLNIPENNIRGIYHKLSQIILSLCHT